MARQVEKCRCVEQKVGGEMVTMVICPICAEARLEPARQALARSEEAMLRVRRRCRKSYFLGARRTGKHRLEKANSESRRLEIVLTQVCSVVNCERVAVTEERARILRAEASVIVGESALARRRNEIEAMRSALSRSKHLFFERLRWRSVLDIFSAFPIRRVRARKSSKERYVRGVMAIVGIPLFNSSEPLLKDILPRNTLNAAIAAVAQLVVSISDAAAVELPHPLSPRSGLSQATIDQKREKGDGSSKHTYPLSLHSADVEDFSIGLKLLQNDVTHLCLDSKVPHDQLWPAEAMLLNLLRIRDLAALKLRNAKATLNSDNHFSFSSQRDDQSPPGNRPPLAERRVPVILSVPAAREDEEDDDDDNRNAPPPAASGEDRIISKGAGQSTTDDDENDAHSDDWIMCPEPQNTRTGRERLY